MATTRRKSFFALILLISVIIAYFVLWFHNNSDDNIDSISLTSMTDHDKTDYDKYIEAGTNLTKLIEIGNLMENKIQYGRINIIDNNTKLIIHFQSSGPGNGLGSTLLQYYYLRSLSFWNKGNIKFDIDKTIKNMLYFDDKKLFSYYLPKQSNINIINNNNNYILKYLSKRNDNINKTKYYQIFNEIGNKMFNRIQYENKYALFSPPISPIFLFIYNGVFLQIIQKEIKYALNIINDTINDCNNVVIHFRGGDILETGGNGYGIIGFSYFYEIINKIYADNNFNKLQICIITQLPLNWRCKNCSNTNSFIKNEYVPNMQQRDMNLYAIFMQKIQDKLKQKLSKFGTLKIISNGSLNIDFTRMVYSKYLICTTSTLCLLASMSRSNKYYNNSYLPKKSIWKLYQPDVPIYNTDLLNFLYLNMTPIYKHQFIDNENRTWFNPSIYHHIYNKTIQDVVDYFFSH